MRDRAPCGACGALVPADRGCRHWRPQTSATMRGERPPDEHWRTTEEQAKRNAAEAVESFRRMMRLGSS
jgi:hypothetical protein